jgi:hypothetical protein
MLPEYFELSEELTDITLEVAPNMKKTFPVLVSNYFEFRDYVYFFNKLCNPIRSVKLKEKLNIFLFNKFLIGNVQDKLISLDLRIVRSNLQYFIFILKTVKNSEVTNLLFNFVFGFKDKNSRTAHSTNKLNKIFQKEIFSDLNGNAKVGTNQLSYFKKCINLDLDYNYAKHDSIRIGLTLLNNLKNYKEGINLIIPTLFETFLEKCPYMTVHKLILPFTEVCLKQLDDARHLLQNRKHILI